MVDSSQVIDPDSGTTLVSPGTRATTQSGSVVSVTKGGNVYVPRQPPEGGAYHIGDGKVSFIPKVGTIAEIYNAHPTTPTEVALAQRIESTKESEAVYTQTTQSQDIQNRLAAIQASQSPQATSQELPRTFQTPLEVAAYAREIGTFPGLIRTTQQENPRSTQPGMFGGGSISPTQTDIFSRIGMLGQITYQSAEQYGRELSYGILPESLINSISKATPSISIPIFLYGGGSSVDVTGILRGGVQGILTDIREHPIEQGIIFGTGAGLGLGLKAVGVGIEAVGGGATALRIGEAATLVGGTALTIVYAYNVGSQLYSSQSQFDVGRIIGIEAKNLLLFGAGTETGFKSFEKILDTYRTSGLTEVSSKSIIAPEYFAGQKYPQIFKGETAGQLREEFFKPISELGETFGTPRGFTASQREIVGEIGKGSSELYGGYTAPRLSATFLKISRDEELFSFSTKGLLSTNKPTATRFEFVSVELAKGVSSSQKELTPFNFDLLKQFGGGAKGKVDIGEPLLERGKAYIPFMKTEKEAIIPFGTKTEKVILTQGKYFEFEGRKVPVQSIKLLPEEFSKGIKLSENQKVISLKDYSSDLSRGSKSSTGSAINPLSSIVYKFSSSKYLTSPSSSLSYSPNKVSSSKSITSRETYPSSNSFSNSYSSRVSNQLRPMVSSSSNLPPYNPPKEIYKSTRRLNFDDIIKKMERETKSNKKISGESYAPSFTAQALGISKTVSPKQFLKIASQQRVGAGIRPVYRIK